MHKLESQSQDHISHDWWLTGSAAHYAVLQQACPKHETGEHSPILLTSTGTLDSLTRFAALHQEVLDADSAARVMPCR